jgi:hypothetical protein
MRGLSILIIAALLSIVVDVMISPNRTAADMPTTTKAQLQNGQSIHGLRVARPLSMKTFPVELVPLP